MMGLFGRPGPEDDARAEVYRRWVAARDPYAIASVVLGVFSLIEFGAILVFGIAGAALGVIALRRLSASVDSARSQGRYLAWTGIVTALLSLVIAARFAYRWI